MAKSKQKYYVVWVGREPGIYSSWSECELQTKGFEGAKYKGFPSHSEAELAAAGSWEEYFSPSVRQHVARKNIADLPESQRPIYPSLAVDAACSGNPGLMEYRGVEASTGKEIFHDGPYAEGTNNIGEFLAIVYALAMLNKKGFNTLPIYSDSRTAQSWVKQKKCKSKLQLNEHNRRLFNVVARAEAWLQNNTYNNPILKWDTKLWGEIPADFGRK